MRVEKVIPRDNIKLKLAAGHWRSRLWFSGTIKQLRGAWALASALKQRQAEAGFDIVQSSDYGLCGAYVPRRSDRRHLVRCSWSRRLYQRHSAPDTSLDWQISSRIENRCIRRADVAYAPSAFIAEDLAHYLKMVVLTLRPPRMAQPASAWARPGNLPERYLIHFGQLSRIKGTDVLAKALPLVWQAEPNFAMLWAGRPASSISMEKLAGLWGDSKHKVTWAGALGRDELYAALYHAEAAVLPSRCDNLPNSVIESLSLGVPVIGSNGASINELVEPGVTGMLIPIGDVKALAQALIDLWRAPMSVNQDALERHTTWAPMQPQVAAARFIELAAARNNPPLNWSVQEAA